MQKARTYDEYCWGTELQLSKFTSELCEIAERRKGEVEKSRRFWYNHEGLDYSMLEYSFANVE